MLNYKDYKLIQPDKDQIAKINELIKTKNGSIFHDFKLNNIVNKAFNTELYYLVDDPLDIKIFAPIHITKNKYGLKKYHFKPLHDIPYAGFVGNELLETNKISIGFFESIKYEGFPYEKEIRGDLSDLRVGETTMVDLSKDEDEIFNIIIHSKRRNMIRKAIKNHVEVKIYTDISGLTLFWPMLEKLHDKLGYEYLNFKYYKEIIEKYSNKNQVFILIAFKEDIPISGILIIGNSNYMHYYKGASDFQLKNVGQGELLQWEAIKLVKSIGVKQYDLCNLEKEKLPSIYRFKTGISNEIVKYPIYTKNAIGYKIVNRFTRIL